MAVHLVMQAFMLLLACELPEATPPIAKPNCKSRCGNLQIPYPFGIGPDCYLDKWFEIVCKGTGGSAQAFLTSIGKEVRQIIISNNPSTNKFIESTIQVQVRAIYSEYCKYAGNHSIVNITGSPFHFSQYHNTFISVGCDNTAIIDNIFPKVFGCESDCKKDMKVDKEVKCSGFNCCESTNIPSNLQTFDVKFRSINKSNDKDDGIKHCKYAFLADKGWLEKSKRDPSSVQYWEYVPVVLEWAIFVRNNNSHELFHFLEGRRQVSCSRSYENKDHLYSFSCRCAPGYEGNPYVDGGCEDINECEDDLLNYCKNKLDCENTEGGYNCEKRKSKLKVVIVDFVMASFSPLVSILNQNKLTGSNYVDWKRNLDIVLTAEEHKYVLTQPCPKFPSLDAPLEEKQRYDRWQKSNEMAKCYILASISNVLQHQMQDVELASDIMHSLKEMFGEQGRSARQETMRQIYNTKMAAGSSVREHCLRMIANLNTLEVLGADIDGESQVDMILQSLPESFKEFRLNYNMNKKIYSLSELMNELVAAEGILGTSSIEANVGEASTSQPKSKGKDKKKKKKDFTKKDGKQIALGVANKGKKTKGKCFHCGEKGHWKRNCPTFKAAKNKGVPGDQKVE